MVIILQEERNLNLNFSSHQICFALLLILANFVNNFVKEAKYKDWLISFIRCPLVAVVG